MNFEILLTIKLHELCFVDPKRIRLLQEIKHTGSINQAAKNANVSYKSAWDHLEAMNEISPKPLLERNTGGKNGGGTTLTHYAERLLQLYDLLAKTQEKAFAILQDEQIPLDSALSATARFAPQSSARNQFFGKVVRLALEDVQCYADIAVEGFDKPIRTSITLQSAERLQLTLNKEVMLMVKAPWIKIHSQAGTSANNFAATVTHLVNKGEHQEITLTLDSQKECFATLGNESFAQGQQVGSTIDPEQIILLTL